MLLGEMVEMAHVLYSAFPVVAFCRTFYSIRVWQSGYWQWCKQSTDLTQNCSFTYTRVCVCVRVCACVCSLLVSRGYVLVAKYNSKTVLLPINNRTWTLAWNLSIVENYQISNLGEYTVFLTNSFFVDWCFW